MKSYLKINKSNSFCYLFLLINLIVTITKFSFKTIILTSLSLIIFISFILFFNQGGDKK